MDTSLLRKHIKLSDIIAGGVAILLLLPYLTPHFVSTGERLAVMVGLLLSLGISWRMTRERHWVMKIFIFAGAALLVSLCIKLVMHFLTIP